MPKNIKHHNRYHSFTISREEDNDGRVWYAVMMIKEPADRYGTNNGEYAEEYFRTREEAEDFVWLLNGREKKLTSDSEMQKMVEDCSSYDDDASKDGPARRVTEEENLVKQEKLRKEEAERIRKEEETRKKKEEDDAVKELFMQHKPSHRKFL